MFVIYAAYCQRSKFEIIVIQKIPIDDSIISMKIVACCSDRVGYENIKEKRADISNNGINTKLSNVKSNQTVLYRMRAVCSVLRGGMG